MPSRLATMTFQKLIRTLDDYWADQGCAILVSYDVEVGAGTMHPSTTLRSLGPDPWNVAYVQASRRPADGRYTRNPQRSQRYFQYQVIMKPSPANIVDLYMGSLEALGFDLKKDDVRLVEDDWESQAAGAAGVGWEVWLNGTEITQFTFFQQMGGIECDPVCAEITYGPERLCLMLNSQNSFWDGLKWSDTLSYQQAEFDAELQNNVYNFELASTEILFQMFDMYEAESKRVIQAPLIKGMESGALRLAQEDEEPNAVGLVYPALDLALKCSHIFNLLDARGAVSVTERAAYIHRIRARVQECCQVYVGQFKVKSEDI